MATGAAADFFLRCGCMSEFDSFIDRRPYHKNCSCALHQKNKKSGGGCPSSGAGRKKSVSYPIRKVGSEGNLALMANAQASPATSPAVAPSKGQLRRFGSSSSFCSEFELEE